MPDLPKQPWLKFYPADWRSEPTLRAVSIGARGMWMEMLCLMWQADPQGSLLLKGRQIVPKVLAGLCGVTLKECEALIAELESVSVFSRDEDGTIFSRRMRNDVAKAARDKANGSSGGNPNIMKGVNPPDNPKGGSRVNARDKAHVQAPAIPSAIATQKPEARVQNTGEAAQPFTRDDLDALETRLRQVAELDHDPSPALFDLSPILGLLDAGYDLDSEILPVIRARKRPGIRSWQFFVQAIRDARATREAAATGVGFARAGPVSGGNSTVRAGERILLELAEAERRH